MIPASLTTRLVLRRLRPPCARATVLVYGYSQEGNSNAGYTLQFPEAEPAVAAGGGTVSSIQFRLPNWRYTDQGLGQLPLYEVTVDHGSGVRTLVSGLSSVSVRLGESVGRGQVLGNPATTQVHFRIIFNGLPLNPVTVSRHFSVYDSRYVPGQIQTLRFAPDKVARSLTSALVRIYNGIVYFIGPAPVYQVNVDFNGAQGAKTGRAVVGVGTSDFWNVYTPVSFIESEYTDCYFDGYFGTIFSAAPDQWLFDYLNRQTTIRLEKVAPLSADAGTQASFDAMLSTYVGGYDFLSVPIENTFKLKGIPAGNYELYLYGITKLDLLPTDFYVTVNQGAPIALSLTPTLPSSFVEGDNYVVQNLVLSANDIVTVKAVGYLSGLQLRRV